MATFTVFDYMFNDENLEKQFEQFFQNNNLDSLFTNEHRSTPIKVTYLDAKAVTNQKGKYAQLLRDFSDVLSLATNNKKFNEATFKVLQTANTFQKMMNNIKSILKEFSTVQERHKFNFWNIVFYNKDLF